METFDRSTPKTTTKKLFIHGNSHKHSQITGIEKVRVVVDNGQDMPETTIEDGVEVPLTKEKPLPKPENVGQYWWDKD